jgi:hypothetical protein
MTAMLLKVSSQENTMQEIITVYSENHMKPIDKLCGQNTALINVKAGGTYIYD